MADGLGRLRFGTGAGGVDDRATLLRRAQQIEQLGYSTFAMPDHFTMPLAPLLALQAVADATSTLRLAQTVLNQDFRHPAVLAKELATLDVLSEGRLQIGIGAGWMREEYAQAGIPYDTASARIERLEEIVVILKGLLSQELFSFSGEHFTITALRGTPRPVQHPHPPIMIGGGGRKLLSVAGRHADIVQIMPSIPAGALSFDEYDLTADAYHEKIDWVRAAAGDRFGDIELGAQLVNVTITDDVDAAFERFLDHFLPMVRAMGTDAAVSKEQFLASPMVAVGSLDEVCDKLLDTRDRLGISYLSSAVGSHPAELAPVIERLAGRHVSGDGGEVRVRTT